MKKIFAIVCLILMLLVVMSACSDEQPEPPVDSNITDTQSDTQATDPSESESSSESEEASESAGETEEVTEPEVSETEPEVSETEPEISETEPEASETEPEVSETEPEVSETEPEVSETEPESNRYTYDLNQYAIVRAADKKDSTGLAVSDLCDAFERMGVELSAVSDDYQLAADPGRKEILIGNTNQPESQAALALLSADNEFVISFHENKIVVVVLHEDAMADAIQHLIDEYFSAAEQGVFSVEKDLIDQRRAGFSVVELAVGGVVKYNVILPANATDSERALAVSLVEKIALYSGADVELTYDDVTPYKASTFSILVGNVNYPEVEQAKEGLGRSQYTVCMIGNKLVVAAHFGRTIDKAGAMLITKIGASGNYENDSVVLHIQDDWTDEETEYLLEFPDFTAGTKKVDIDNANKTLMLGYIQVKEADFTAYCQALEDFGYRLWQSREVGENQFRTYRSDVGEIVLGYAGGISGGTMHIYTDRFTETAPSPEVDTDYVKVTEATLHVMSLDYTHRTVYDGHGMNYVYTLEDGRYIVMDGGYNKASGSDDYKRIYDYLVANNKHPSGKVVIAAWYLTHSHGDHVGAIADFINVYKDEVTIEYCIASGYVGDTWTNSTLPNLLKQTNTKLIKPHTGQIITFCNTQLEIMYTVELLYPGTASNTNDASLVIRFHQNGHTMLFTGDASERACTVMKTLYGEALKSDIFQVNHHGHSGGNWEFYNLASDKYTLWTCSEEAFFYRTIGTYVSEEKSIVDTGILWANRQLALKVGFENCFYADGVVEQITFPEGGEIQISAERDTCVDPTTVPEQDRP